MKGEGGNEEERDFTHRVVTTEFLLNRPNFHVTTLYQDLFQWRPSSLPSGLCPIHDRAVKRGVSSTNDKQPRLKMEDGGQRW